MTDKTRVGVIGVGYWGKKHVAEFSALGVEVIASDLLDENLSFCKEKYNTKITKDYKEIQSDKTIKAVTICTPNSTHYSISKSCLNAGKNVFVEKPIAITKQEAIELVELARDKGLLLVVGHIFRFNNAVIKVKEMVDKGELGEIRIVKLRWSNMERLLEDRDVIFDLAPHPFDIINFLFNRNPDEVSCVGNAYRRGEDAEAVFINCRLGKIIINIELSWITPIKTRSLHVIGSEKSVFVDCDRQKIQVYQNNELVDLNIEPNNTIRTELKAFLDCVSDRKKVSIARGTVGVDVIEMIEVVRKSLKEKKTLRFSWA